MRTSTQTAFRLPTNFYCCPACRSDVEFADGSYECGACGRSYPVIMGIPDFRIVPDRYIGIEDDREKARHIMEQAGDGTLEELVRYYWSITPDATPEQAERFTKSVLSLERKWVELLPEMEHGWFSSGETDAPFSTAERPVSVLEVGCGTGGFLQAAANRYDRLVGVDIAFRWLVVARRRLDLAGLDVPLVCACAEHLPFRDDSFDLAVAESVIEHVSDQERSLAECGRILKDSAGLYIETSNRFSLLPEPHVNLWGVGFLPRSWAGRYVERMKGMSYELLRPVSWWELRRMLVKTGFSHVSLVERPVTAAESERLGRRTSVLVAAYEWILRIPIAGWIVRTIAPLLSVYCLNTHRTSISESG